MPRQKTNLFTVNGQPLLAPDIEPEFSYEDLDASDSGRDESGYMHRFPVRYKVGKWTFSYSHLSEADRQYMESLFPDGPTFSFGHPDRRTGGMVATECYRSQYSITWKNARTGLWSNYKFSIIEC